MVAGIPDRKQQLQALNLLILLLPPIHRDCLKVCVCVYFTFLCQMSTYSPGSGCVICVQYYEPAGYSTVVETNVSPISLDSLSLHKRAPILKRFLSVAKLLLHLQHL